MHIVYSSMLQKILTITGTRTAFQHEQHWPCLFFYASEYQETLTANYGIKQSQFTKPTPKPYTRNLEESNEAFDRMIRG